MLQEFIAPAASFGISATVMPGPLIAFLVNTTLTHGWRKAMLVVWAPLITDAPILILMTFLLGQLPADILKLIELGGGIRLLIIAWGAYKQFRNASVPNLPADEADDSDRSGRRILLIGITVNFLSPGPWLFWAMVNGPLLVKALGESVAHAAVFMLAFYGTFLFGLCAWVFLFHYARHVPVEYLRYIILATVLLLLNFGIGLMIGAAGLQEYHWWLVAGIVGVALLRWRSHGQATPAQ